MTPPKYIDIIVYMFFFAFYVGVEVALRKHWSWYTKKSGIYTDTIASVQVTQYYLFAFSIWTAFTYKEGVSDSSLMQSLIGQIPTAADHYTIFATSAAIVLIICSVSFLVSILFVSITFGGFLSEGQSPTDKLKSHLTTELRQLPSQIKDDIPIKVQFLFHIAHELQVLKANYIQRPPSGVLFLVSSDTSLSEPRSGELSSSWHTALYCYLQQHWAAEIPPAVTNARLYGIGDDLTSDEREGVNSSFERLLLFFKNKLQTSAADLLDGLDTRFDGANPRPSDWLYSAKILGIRAWFAHEDAIETWGASMRNVQASDLLFSAGDALPLPEDRDTLPLPEDRKEVILNCWVPRTRWADVHKVAVELAQSGTLSRALGRAFDVPQEMSAFLDAFKLFVDKARPRRTKWNNVIKELQAMSERAKNGFDPRRDIVALSCGLAITGSDQDIQDLRSATGLRSKGGVNHRALQFYCALIFGMAALCYKGTLPFFLVAEALMDDRTKLKDRLKNHIV